MKISEKEKKQVENIIGAASWFNGGHGLIVPERVAKILRANNIRGKYAVSPNLLPRIK